ncbi:DUF397 domain-containing protein [Actinomadura sp. KC345]|uniref:DUF397 domain-containing protein n=1 Tax=Actinomadura sp. KC345 TaxID=2530371 RepID=UPI00104A7FCD|nr:DUF397 domain-containing protein [Actinomadura sp. KC345]TDC58295.1 DUF397 domain-containing protein [Actinomadura sp. KC345]
MTPPITAVTRWRKSSYSNGLGGECVEVAVIPGCVLVRDSKDPNGPTIGLTPAAARALISRALDEATREDNAAVA